MGLVYETTTGQKEEQSGSLGPLWVGAKTGHEQEESSKFAWVSFFLFFFFFLV